jgi:hypothetical protein
MKSQMELSGRQNPILLIFEQLSINDTNNTSLRVFNLSFNEWK